MILSCFQEQNEDVKYFLCELYLHNFFLEDENDGNPSPFIGYVQFQPFISFVKNQIKWPKAYIVFLKSENGLDLWVEVSLQVPCELS